MLPVATRRPRIVLADDHHLITDCLGPLLEPHFDIVGTAENGRELVELVLHTRPDAAVVDVSMPMLNGIEATRRLAKQIPETKIVVLTMHSDRPYIEQAMLAG